MQQILLVFEGTCHTIICHDFDTSFWKLWELIFMTFNELKEFAFKELGISKLADIARELNVTPQVVNNWKIRDQVPYKYVKRLKKV